MYVKVEVERERVGEGMIVYVTKKSKNRRMEKNRAKQLVGGKLSCFIPANCCSNTAKNLE